MQISRYLLVLFYLLGASAHAESMRLEYKAKSGILNLGSTSIFIEETKSRYNIQMDRNLSWPGVMKDLSSTAVSGMITDSSLKPQNYIQTRTGRELTRTTKINWKAGVPSVTMDPVIQTNEKTVLNILTAHNSIDPLSSIFYVMKQSNMKGNCYGEFISFDGFSSINTRLIPLEEKFVDTPVYSGQALGCRLEMRGISGLVMGGKNAEQTVAMVLWLGRTENNAYIPVLIQSQEGLKTISLRLVDFSQ